MTEEKKKLMLKKLDALIPLLDYLYGARTSMAHDIVRSLMKLVNEEKSE